MRNTSFGAVSIYALPNVLAARIIMCMLLQLCVCVWGGGFRVYVCVFVSFRAKGYASDFSDSQ